MPNVKLVVIYPPPKDIEAFEQVYQNQHVPMAVAKLARKTKIVATKVLSSPQGAAPVFYRIAEIYFSINARPGSMRCLRGRETDARKCRLDFLVGGTPIFLIAEEQRPFRILDKSAQSA